MKVLLKEGMAVDDVSTNLYIDIVKVALSLYRDRAFHVPLA